MTHQAKSFLWSASALSHVARFLKDERGGLLPLIAGSITVLTGFTGLAIDGARLFYAKDVLQKSLDAAGLAAGHAMDVDDMRADAQAFFDANFDAAGTLIENAQITINISDDNSEISLVATTTVDTVFMPILGIESVNLSASTQIARETRGMELALVMDNTGSMRGGGRMDAMKQAARDLVEAVYGDNDINPNLYVSLVPYTATVNVGSIHEGWLRPAGRDFVADSANFGDGETSWKGCVMARASGYDQTDMPPRIDNSDFDWAAPLPGNPFGPDTDFDPYYYADEVDNNWIDEDGDFNIDERNSRQNNGTGPNLGCGPAITPLVASKTTVIDAIDEMLPWHRGGTTSNLGLVWGWRTLSPLWRGLWRGGDRPSELPLDHEVPFMDKVVVVLTDGQNQFFDFQGGGPFGSDFTAYDREDIFEATLSQSALREINDRFATTCAAMKQDNIIIYSITFGSTPNQATQNLYRGCASNPTFYFHAPSNGDLQEAFDAIGRQLSNLRLSG